jgi:outer membrane phospholipase A
MFYHYVDRKENPDIVDYRGRADVYFGLLTRDWRLSATLRKGTRSTIGSVKIDAVPPMRVTDHWFAKAGAYGANGFVFLQYFNGWGETILDYDIKKPSQVRAGFMLVP